MNKNMAKVVEHFIIHEEWEQNQKELCEFLEIYPRAMKKLLETLEQELKIIKVTRKIAKSKFYKINQKSELINPLRVLIKKLTYQKALETAEAEERREKELKDTELIHKEVKSNE